ncbi:hypothetical protein ATN83_3258 [Raoultella ornithinolytica]|nr:hypothetical protein ATN83_3258 [Raoultella ornithinolytica]KDV94801.1 hypothetical protein AB00_1696 [Raoultella ornithinolytica 2-156-04_S1_C1]KDX14812.1 hypothetical protein AB28_1890 [Raoultella ornithinolytica 2-156-04_S1_C2]
MPQQNGTGSEQTEQASLKQKLPEHRVRHSKFNLLPHCAFFAGSPRLFYPRCNLRLFFFLLIISFKNNDARH